MAHHRIDGMLIVAKLKRRLLGAAVYRDVAIRQHDGDIRRLGTLVVLDDMKHALVPGSRGSFYAYDVAGSKGIHGFRPEGRGGHGYFPFRWEILSYVMAAVSLPIVLWFHAIGSSMTWFSAFFGVLSLVLGIVFTTSRIAAMRAFRADGSSIPPTVEAAPSRT